jgi:hypothetical protein
LFRLGKAFVDFQWGFEGQAYAALQEFYSYNYTGSVKRSMRFRGFSRVGKVSA